MTDRPLWAHQTDIIERASTTTHLAILAEMGTGKTRTTIEILKQKCHVERRLLKTLIVAPTVVVYNWKAEIAKYSDINPAHVLVLSGTQVERKKLLERTPNYFIVVMNYETLLMDMVFKHLKSWAPDFMILDESHRAKNPKAQRTKRLLALGHDVKYKYILSGTPVTNSEGDLFSQFLFLDGGETFGKSYFTFRTLWFHDANAQKRKFSPAVTWPDWQPKPYKADEFRQKVMSKSVSVRKEECLDLPPYIQQTIEVGMSPEQQRAYKSMKDDFLVFIKSHAFSAELAVTKALRLLQITSGILTNTEGQTHVFQNTPKDKALLELIEASTNKVVVWANWKASQSHLRQVFKKHKIEHRVLVGDSGAEARDEALRDFADKPDVKVMLASPGAGGIGISLTSADTAIYYSRNFSYEQDAQSAARIHRGGSERWSKVFRMDLVVPGTIEESCLEALARKEELKDSIVGGKLKV